MRITDIHNPWRDKLLPAHFDGNPFHVEAGSRSSGRRIVVHEFPKKDLPYSEDMGRRAIEFTVRGYCISYPRDASSPLYMRDYRIARDRLQTRLDTGGAGVLQLPNAIVTTTVVCQRYRLTEEDRFGGYCTFDMSFVEFGLAPGTAPTATDQVVQSQSSKLKQQILGDLQGRANVQS